jgi:hypothetical protein
VGRNLFLLPNKRTLWILFAAASTLIVAMVLIQDLVVVTEPTVMWLILGGVAVTGIPIILSRRIPFAQTLFAIYLLAEVIVPAGLTFELSPTLPLISLHRFLLFANLFLFAVSVAVKRSMVQMGNLLDKSFVLYLVAIVPSVFLSFDRTMSLKYFLSEIVFLGILISYVSFHLVRNEGDAIRLVSWILLVGSVAALIGVGEVLLGYDYKQQEFFGQFYFITEDRLAAMQWVLHERGSLIGAIGPVRAESGFSHPIEFGSFLVLLFPLLWGKLGVLKRAASAVPILQIGILLGALYYASVRGPWLIVLMVILLSFRKNWGVSLAILSVLIFIVVPFFGSILYGGGASLLDFNITDQTRFYAIQNNLRVFASHPLFGVGLGQVEFGEFYGAWDNYLTMLLRGIGLIGTVGWIGVWAAYAYVVRPWGKRYSLAKGGWIVRGVSLAILGALVMSALQNTAFQFKQTNVFLMALMGIALKVSKIIRTYEKEQGDLKSVSPHGLMWQKGAARR